MSTPAPKWIDFRLSDAQPALTQRWDVLTKTEHPSQLAVLLGRVGWAGRWRCYTFVPNRALDLIFEKTCLRDIAAFCEDETTKHRAARRVARDQAAERLRA